MMNNLIKVQAQVDLILILDYDAIDFYYFKWHEAVGNKRVILLKTFSKKKLIFKGYEFSSVAIFQIASSFIGI